MKTESELAQFPYREQEPLQGNEQLYFDNRKHEATVLNFWKWSASDLLSNATRGRFAEFIVALALGISFEKIRDEWGAYDLETPEGIRIEVKSAAYVQSWYQQKESTISFRVPKTRAWDSRTNKQERESKRQANVYVFALLAHRHQKTIDPLNLDQWHFYVLPTSVLDARTRSQHSITLKTLDSLSGGPVSFAHLREAVLRAHRGEQ